MKKDKIKKKKIMFKSNYSKKNKSFGNLKDLNLNKSGYKDSNNENITHKETFNKIADKANKKKSIKELSKQFSIKANKGFAINDSNTKNKKKISTLTEEELSQMEELQKLKKEYKNLLTTQKIFKRKSKYGKGITRKEIEKDLRKKFRSAEKKVFLVLFFLIISAVFAIMLLQIKTLDKADIKNIESLREVDLKTETSTIRQKNSELSEKINNLEKSIENYSNSVKENTNAEKLLNDEVKAAELLLGYTEVKGEGIIVELRDNQYEDVDNNDILTLVNKLWTEGAEAISINDERIVLNSDISLVEGNKIFVNSKRMFSPYIVKAIGNTKNLENALTSKNGYINSLLQNDKAVSYSVKSMVEVPGYKGEIRFKYGR